MKKIEQRTSKTHKCFFGHKFESHFPFNEIRVYIHNKLKIVRKNIFLLTKKYISYH